MTRIQKRRRKCSQHNASASAVDSRPDSVENAIATAVDCTPALQECIAASALESRPASQENASASALDSRPVSSFEFSVTSEEGINLYVDMNSSLVDWHKRLENGMCVCRCIEEIKFQSFREQLLYLGNNRKQTKDSFAGKSDSGVKDGNSSFDSSPSPFNKNSENTLLNQPDAENGPLEMFAAEACSFALEASDNLEEQKEHPVSISSNLNCEGMISSPRTEKVESTDQNVFHVPLSKIASCSMESVATDGPQTTLNDKIMKLNDDISTSVTIKMEQNRYSVSPLPVSSMTSAIDSKLSEVSSVENDPAFSSSVNSLNLTDAEHSTENGIEELTKSIKNEHHTPQKVLSAEEQVSGGLVDGTEEASCKSEKVISDGGHNRKRYKSQLDKVSLQFSGRILRSAVRPRRSLRLFTKAATP